MRRCIWILAVLACTASAREASADPIRSFLRFWGIHCGEGYNAYNGTAPYVVDDAYLRPVEPANRRQAQPSAAPAPPRVDESQSFRPIPKKVDNRSSRRMVR